MNQNNFTIISRISDGPSAIVAKALQNNLNRFVLLKILHAYLLRDAESYERFMREAKACALLHSDRIVQIYDVVDYEGSPTIVMEFVEGKSLEQILHGQEKLDEDSIFRIATEVLEGLSYAHQHGVIHRDIKPSNILIADSGAVKITDFGIATIASAPSLTVEGNLLGTPAYMSPEQMRGEPVDEQSDLFSLGATLCELKTGKKIFDGSSFAECFNKIISFDGVVPADVIDSFSPTLLQLITNLLSPKKENRFASASEALAFLRNNDIAVQRAHPRPLISQKRLTLVMASIGIIGVGIGAFYLTGTRFTVPVRPVSSKTAVADTTEMFHPENGSRNEMTVTGIKDKKDARRVPITTLHRASMDAKSEKQESVPGRTEGAGSDSGYVSISCLPWAKVFIDNQYIETTPMAGTVKIKAGHRTVTFTNPDFVPITRQITVSPDSETSIGANFLETAGYIFITATPWAEIYIDDQYRDTTPLDKPLAASSGIRKLKLRNPHLGKELVREITLIPKDTIRLSFDLTFSSKQ